MFTWMVLDLVGILVIKVDAMAVERQGRVPEQEDRAWVDGGREVGLSACCSFRNIKIVHFSILP